MTRQEQNRRQSEAILTHMVQLIELDQKVRLSALIRAGFTTADAFKALIRELRQNDFSLKGEQNG